MPEIEHKAFSIKALTDDGQIQAVISTFDNVDRDGDIMLADAFKSSDGKSIPMVWSHDWSSPVGKGTIKVTPAEAVFSGQFFMETTRGQDAYKTVKAMADLQQYSIGFRILDADFGYKEDDGGNRTYIRTIKDIELFEASPVLVGAAYGTHTVAIKGLNSEDPLKGLDASIHTLEALVEAKAGATLSAANLGKLHSIITAAKALHDASNCEGGDECPFAEKAASPALTEREKQKKELEAALASMKL